MIGSTAFFVASMMAQASETPAAATLALDPNDKIVCRREAPTGSLIASRKICHSKREWSELADAGRREAEKLQGKPSPPTSE